MPTPTSTLSSEPIAADKPALAEEAAVTSIKDFQLWFLLHQLLEATPYHRLTKGQANKNIPAEAKRKLQLDTTAANRLRLELVNGNFIRVIHLPHQKIAYELTDTGRERLQTLAPYPFSSQKKFEPGPVLPEVAELREGYLLFQVFQAPEYTLPKGDANRFDAWGRFLDLTPPLANHLRQRLAAAGLLEIKNAGRRVKYHLSEAGRAFLGQRLRFPDMGKCKFSLNGLAMNALAQLLRAGSPVQSPTKPMPADLSEAIYLEVQELAREKYSHSKLVPIHEIRKEIATNHGTESARHEVFDEAVQTLRRQGRIRMIAISDLSLATIEQLNDSIPNYNETLYYLEIAHD